MTATLVRRTTATDSSVETFKGALIPTMYYYEKNNSNNKKNTIKIKVSAKRVHTPLVLTPLHSSTTRSQ